MLNMATLKMLKSISTLLFNLRKSPAITCTITTLRNNSSKRLCSSSAKTNCWKCGSERSNVLDIFCDKCNVLQGPIQTRNYFKVFDLNSRYNLDVKALQQKYRKMQSVLHPDKFSNKSDQEKAISADYSSLVNKAYNTLQSPLNRALHLLFLNDENIGEDDKASDPAFLMEIMELNEEVEEAETRKQLKHLNIKNNQMLDELTKEASGYFEAKDISKAKEIVIKMKYYSSLSKRINDLLRERGVTD